VRADRIRRKKTKEKLNYCNIISDLPPKLPNQTMTASHRQLQTSL
jgi:hypothetical protein